eukprot:TRINITY_DN30875_c0_g1_i1.p1 TRINITY_DN30875_c0_g1~~TRINITY_DN30875_c0_g1_i1.p1  ORF type:complete len:693 (-),score=72.69 TRINITY_DN30875_c0_g1_i1:111-2189(-)
MICLMLDRLPRPTAVRSYHAMHLHRGVCGLVGKVTRSQRGELLEALRACGVVGGGSSDGTVAVLARMRAEGFLRDSRDYTVTAKALGKACLWEDAVGLLRSMDVHQVAPHIITLNAVVAATATGHAWMRSLALLQEVTRLKLDPDGVTYNSVINACGRGTVWSYGLSLLTEMRMLNMTPNIVTYSALVSSCEKGTRWEVACKLFLEARRHHLRMDVVMYNAMISACDRGSRWELALDYLSEVERCPDIRPTITTITAAIVACGRVSQWKIALTLLGSLHSRELRPNLISLNATIQACAHRRPDLALQLVQQARDLGLEPDVIQYSSLMQAYGDCWESAVALLGEMRHRVVTPDIVAYDVLLASLSKSSAWHVSLVALADAKASGLTPTETTRLHIFNALAEGRQWARAAELLSDFRNELTHSHDMFQREAALARSCFLGAQWVRAAELLIGLRERALQEPARAAQIASELHWEAALLVLFDAVPGKDLVEAVRSPRRRVGIQPSTSSLPLSDSSSLSAPRASAACPEGNIAGGTNTYEGVGNWRQVLVSSVALVLYEAGHVPEALSIFWESVEQGLANPWKSRELGVVDLHDLSVASARLAVLAVLVDRLCVAQAARIRDHSPLLSVDSDFIVVVGRGSHSPAEESVLQPAILAMLRDELGLEAYESQPTRGRIRVPSASLQEFCARPTRSI